MFTRRLAAVALASAVVAGCSAVPNLDHGSAACQNASGIGPHAQGGHPDVPTFAGDVLGKSPEAAAAFARGLGHTVVFNVQIPGYGECWCQPPPMGSVTQAWWGQHGALWLMVEGVAVGHTPEDPPFLGWECDLV